MNELHKYATFSVDLLGSPKKINSVFSMGRARIFYKGANRNRTIIEGDVAEEIASTIPGTPIVGLYDYYTEDFEGHTPSANAYGFVPLDPHAKWVKYAKEGIEREYLEVDVVIWDGRFEEAKEVLSQNKHLSMELNPKTMKGKYVKKGVVTYFQLTYAEFSGITILGEDKTPCFEDAQFFTAYSEMVNAYALYIEEAQRNNEGGKDIMEDNKEIVEPEVTTEAVIDNDEQVIETETVEVPETVENTVEDNADVIEPEDGVEEEAEVEVVETVEDSDAEMNFSAEDEEDNKEEDDEENNEENNDDDDSKEEDNKEDDQQSNEDGKNYEALESELAEVKAKYESLENKYNEALNSLSKYTKKEKLEIISKFSTKLESEELITKLTNEVDNYSLSEIKGELGQALVEQLATAEDEAEDDQAASNFSLNINIADNTLGNSAWDLVKRHKQSK